MERIGEAQLTSALARTSAPLMKRLLDDEAHHLKELLEQMADRYPTQDLSDAMEGYLWDFERLALRYSMAEVREALAEWRITPGAAFFPRPDEIAGMIERGREVSKRAIEERDQAARRKREISEFWQWAPQWMEDTGNDEAELLRRFPGYRGTKPR